MFSGASSRSPATMGALLLGVRGSPSQSDLAEGAVAPFERGPQPLLLGDAAEIAAAGAQPAAERMPLRRAAQGRAETHDLVRLVQVQLVGGQQVGRDRGE